MKFKKIRLSTQLSDLYGRDGYQSHIEEGKEYWGFFSRDSEISEGWYKIKITYIRSGCMFYIFSDSPEVEERFCPLSCFFTSVLSRIWIISETIKIKNYIVLIRSIQLSIIGPTKMRLTLMSLTKYFR